MPDIRHIFASLWMLLLLGIALTPSVFAADFTSAHFIARDPLSDSFGGSGTSTSFSSIQSGGQTATGESTSTSFTLRSGFLYFDSFAPKSQNWRWYDDETNETPASALAGENVAPAGIANLNIIKLRLSIAETAGIGAPNLKLRLQYATSSNFVDGGYDVAEQWACAGSSQWCYADGAGVDNVVITTKTLSDADACAGSVGNGCGTHNESGTSTSAFTHRKNAVTEYEFTIKQSGASANTVYFFRAFDVTSSTTVPLNTGATYPSLSVEGATLTFTIGGLPNGSATEGVTTDVDTTSTGVTFGALAIAATTTAAQRLTITTNAPQGYTIFAYERQGLLRDGSGEIPPITATNASPAAWLSSCASSATGCYGYHTGDDVLGGGSTRFAPNDTYAQFTSAPTEIAYSAVPVTNKSTDMVYRVRANALQDAGSYSTDLVYIIVPTF